MSVAAEKKDRPKPGPRSPANCCHEPGPIQNKDAIEDGKGNVIGYHIRCKHCGIALGTDLK